MESSNDLLTIDICSNSNGQPANRIRFTGAGPKAVAALSQGDLVPPPSIAQAIDEICEATASQNSRLWIDAEQQVFQPAIDAWTIDLM